MLRSASAGFVPAFPVGNFTAPVPGGSAVAVYGATSVPSADVLGQSRPGLLWGAYASLAR